MSFVLTATSTDAYTQANTLENLPACGKLTLDVTGASIYWQAKLQYPGHTVGGAWAPEVPMVAGSKSVTRGGITGIRFRSATPGTPALVTAELIPLAELA